jgi:L,D-transpeptidase ErfK/SrfK
MERGIFTYDPQAVLVLREGTRLRIPDSSEVDSILEYQGLVYIDINIPEFKLRIWHYDSLLYTFPVRVGQNTSKYLAVSNANVDLRTQVGSGCIVRLNRNPDFVNPTNGKEYKVTRRDDERVTLMPRIPWIEPELNGIRYGQLIHPTTNPNTLGKAYSNGCIGTKEGDMWIIYYYASLGTSVNVRYDREVVNDDGKKVILKDIYPGYKEEIAKQKWKFRREVCVCSDVN